MNRNLLVSFVVSSFILLSGFSTSVNAQVIEILCTSDEPCGSSTGTTTDGTIFDADPNPTEPATGTGVFEPFVRIQDSRTEESGYNTDTGEPDINYDAKAGIWTHSVLFGDLATVERDGTSYYLFQLDSNEAGAIDSTKNLIDITDIQIFIESSDEFLTPELFGGYTGTQYDSFGDATWGDNLLLGEEAAWTLDSAVNGDVTVVLQSSICEANGQCGSGHGDMGMYINASYFDGYADTDHFAFYSEYDVVGSGFEEWRYNSGVSVPETSTLPLMITGLMGIVFVNRKNRKKKV